MAISLAICTWRASGYMSGARRDSMNTLGSMSRAWALASAFLRMLDRLLSMRARTGMDASYMDKDMVIAPLSGEWKRIRYRPWQARRQSLAESCETKQ
ncbi:hypothetical protein FQZ97_1274260 [compost metagenome]